MRTVVGRGVVDAGLCDECQAGRPEVNDTVEEVLLRYCIVASWSVEERMGSFRDISGPGGEEGSTI